MGYILIERVVWIPTYVFVLPRDLAIFATSTNNERHAVVALDGHAAVGWQRPPPLSPSDPIVVTHLTDTPLLLQEDK